MNLNSPHMRELKGYLWETTGKEIRTVGSTNSKRKSILQIPGIIDDDEETARTNRGTQSLSPPGHTHLLRLTRRGAQKFSPTGQVSQCIGLRPQASPEHAIREVGAEIRISGKSHRQRRFTSTRQAME